jgi:hypothetical protein
VTRPTGVPLCDRDTVCTEVQMRELLWTTCLTLALAAAYAVWASFGAPVSAAAPGNVTAPTWTRLVQLADGRTFVTDGSLAIDVALAKPAVLPTVVLSGASASLLEGYLTAPFIHECGLAELKAGGKPGTYVAPSGVVLNAKYVEYLRHTLPTARLRLRLKGDRDPVVLLSHATAIGVLMPMAR